MTVCSHVVHSYVQLKPFALHLKSQHRAVLSTYLAPETLVVISMLCVSIR